MVHRREKSRAKLLTFARNVSSILKVKEITIYRVMREMGIKGGKSRMDQLTPAQRTALGKKAATARWGNKTKAKLAPKETE